MVPTARWGVFDVLASVRSFSSFYEDAASAATASTWILEVRLRRNPTSFLLSQTLPCVLVVFGGMGALYLDPASPPMMGARVGLMITAMLVVINMGSRVSLRLPILMWLECVKHWISLNPRPSRARSLNPSRRTQGRSGLHVRMPF